MIDHENTFPGVSAAPESAKPQPYEDIAQLLASRSERTPEALAILAPGRHALTYARLWRQVEDTVRALRARGVRRNDRVALVLPNGPEMAVAFLAIASGATCMPLNPAYTDNEFAFYLTRLNVRALIIQAGMQSSARAVAHAHGIRMIELQPLPEAEAGRFTLADTGALPPAAPVYAEPEDVALVLHTSGTTSKPKSVPLSHANICISADHTRVALSLEAHDRYLNVMPLFHIGGLISGLLPSLLAGASVVCTDEFEASKFFDWLDAFRPTWYMGVSVIHQELLAQAPRSRELLARSSLRFIRSPAAPLSLRVLAELERTFNVPVLCSYGVTEASLVCCNPLPPRDRKPGSVGVAAGPEVAIIDVNGHRLSVGETGEIVIRGPNVMQGYEDEPSENQTTFINGWFRTGDQGLLDTDGYLFITGRLKELINRGGELVAPQEVDDTFMEHPGVAQAVTFGVPHARWEEDVMTAVVLRPHASVTDSELRRFAATRLAQFKVPSQIVFVESVPMSATGKPQRYRFAEQFGHAAWAHQHQPPRTAATAPRTVLETALERLWATTLGCESVGLYDNFFRLGGDSLLAAQLLSSVYEVTHVEISARSFFNNPTLTALIEYITTARQTLSRQSDPLFHSVPRADPLL